jgi:SpoVK/Ycf46/Vps4 family AAA+-type ATPase
MIKVMAKKNKTSLAAEAVPPGFAAKGFSGADIESIVLAAKRHALTQGRDGITRDDLELALNDFIPSAQGLEKEKQELAAVLECTSMSFLPDEWRARVAQLDGRAKLQERMAAIRRLIEE